MKTNYPHPKLIIVLAILAVLAAACGSAAPDPQAIADAVAGTVEAMPTPEPVYVEVTNIAEVTREVEVTRIVEVTVEVTRIVESTREVIVTATPTETPTPTVTPTAIPEPTATTPSSIGSLDDLIMRLQAAGLEAVDPQPMFKEDYGLGPYVATGVHFFIPSLCDDCGGRAFVGAPDEIEALRDYYDSLGEASAILFSWTFVSPDGRALIQINGDLPEEQAVKYQAVIEGS